MIREQLFLYYDIVNLEQFIKKITSKSKSFQYKEGGTIWCNLASENQIENWKEPLIIASGNNQFQITVNVDKIKQTICSYVKIKKVKPVQSESQHLIEVEMHIPIINNINSSLRGIIWLLQQYALVNTHVSFHFEVPWEDNNGKKYLRWNYPQTQKMTKRWSNQISIFYYSYREFEQFILSLIDENITAYDVIKYFREGTNIRKDKALMTVGQLKSNPQKILELYTQLRTTINPKAELDVPFEIKKKARTEALRRRIEQLGWIVTDSKYLVNHGIYESEDRKVRFPFIFEVAIVSINSTTLLYCIEGINSSIPHGMPFLGYPNAFVWKTGTKTNNAINVYDILEKYGYSLDQSRHRKSGSIIILNLISPRIDYENYGKSQIDLKPFADIITNTVFKTCSSHSGNNNNGIDSKWVTAIDILKLELYERLKDVERNPNLKISDRWTQSTVYYRIRPLLIAKGIKVSRKHITISIRSICENIFGKRRDELGIIAADRAQLYFKGKSYDVGFDELTNLMEMGTDLLIIEKEGVVEVLAPFADRYGIALLNTRGFLTEYATILSKLSKRHGCNVAILTDLDVSGLLLAKKVPNIQRIGIDFDTLNYLNLTQDRVEEPYNAEYKHTKPLEEMAYNEPSLYRSLQFVKHKRIEIDSVLAAVGNDRFWDFIIHKTNQIFPTRDYNRAIDIPEFVMPRKLEEMLELLEKNLASFVKPECQLIKDELSDFSGFIKDIKKKEREIEDRIRNKITESKDIQSLIEDIERLITESNFNKLQSS